MKLSMKWTGNMSFDTRINEHHVKMDAKPAAGGSYAAPTPKELVLAGLCGCTGMDVAWILRKMRQEFTGLDIEAEASQTEGEPAVFDRIKLHYHLTGEKLLPEKLKQAVDLSQSKYCGVSAMIAKTAKIEYEIHLNGASIGTGSAAFTI